MIHAGFRCGQLAWLGPVAAASGCQQKVLARPAGQCSHRCFVLADRNDNNCACAPPDSVTDCTTGSSELRVAKMSSVCRIARPVAAASNTHRAHVATGEIAHTPFWIDESLARGWHIRWVSVPGWNKAHVRRDVLAGVSIESEEVVPGIKGTQAGHRNCVPISPDDPDGPGSWKEELQSLTVVVVYQGCEVRAETYVDEFKRRGRQGLVLLHLGNEVPFDTADDSSFCNQRMSRSASL